MPVGVANKNDKAKNAIFNPGWIIVIPITIETFAYKIPNENARTNK